MTNYIHDDGNWRLWDTNPPQIPRVPIHTREHVDELTGAVLVFWKPSGIYREEFWSVCGEWI